MVSTSFLVGLVAMATGAVSTPLRPASLADRSPIPGFNIEVLEWIAQVEADSEIISVNGTAQDVYTALEDIDPELEGKLLGGGPSPLRLDWHKTYRMRSYKCSHPSGNALVEAIQEGIIDLIMVPGRPKKGPSPGSCVQVSCSYGSAIWWCNESGVQSAGRNVLDPFNSIAEGAAFLMVKCSDEDRDWFAGEVALEEEWKVVVGGVDSC
ncbi:hypothetical protein QBC34DRAFT_433163 [Podospora aff. communis PSN243]|uniref:Ecp2 effector protein domain-containing protein n=1 Tax=Podospora aff. communis PSN243 TaxID=3040156 RepID=A0AAV9H1M8_9PEZI|nr:hypothetical protein QBC34DRAFT_433163 [Podospora aff. communis PSN243]